MSNQPPLQWAAKVRPDHIRRLYEQDARGIVDEALIDEVGVALYGRCRSILLVSSQQIECPRCDRVFRVEQPGDEVLIACPSGCGWTISGEQHHRSWRHRDLIGTNTPAFQIFVDRYPHAATPRQKMVLIDQLIHAFHQSIRNTVPHRSAANNLIEGNHRQVVALLDALSYGDETTPELRDTRDAWKATVEQVQALRRSRP